MAVTYNLKGTTNSSFQIGKKGVVLTPADNTSATTVTFPNATGTAALLESTQTFTGAITFDASGNSVLVSDTLRIAQSGSGLRMTNVGAFDNDGSDNFRIYGTNSLYLRANGENGGGLSIDSTNQDVTVDNDLIVGGNLTVQGTTTTVDSTAINVQNAFVFEGVTADDFETTLTVTDPTADRTITLPDATGQLVLRDTTDTLSNKTMTAPVLNAPVFSTGTNSPYFTEIRFNNSNIMKFNQMYTGAASGSYFSANEYQKVVTITPDGDAQNYQVIGRITAQNAAETHTVYFNAALRSNTLPDLDWTIDYSEEYNGNRYIDPQLWTKETATAGFIFAFKTLGTIYGTVTVDFDVIPRTSSQLVNVSVNSTQNSEQASVDAGYTANDMTRVLRRQGTVHTLSGNLLPDTTETYDIGSSTLRFNDIYLAGTTIDLGGAKLTNDGSDNLDIKDSSGNRKIIRASAIELVDSSGKKMKLERDATSGKLKQTRKNADGSDEGSSDTIDIVGDTSPQLGGTLDANGNTIDMGTNTITDTKVGEWDTAYSWGDHSTQSYLSGDVGFPTDLGLITGSASTFPIGTNSDFGTLTGDTFVGLGLEDLGVIRQEVTATSTDTLSNKTLSAPSVTGAIELAVTSDPSIVTDKAHVYAKDADADAVTNLLTHSEQFDNSAWVDGTLSALSTVTANDGTDPLGGSTADRISGGTGTSMRAQQTGVSYTNGTTYTFSVYIKGTSGQTVGVGRYNPTQDGDVTVTTHTLDGTWQRLSHTFTATATNSGGRVVISGNGDKSQTATDFLVWGAQLEAGASSPGVYVQTTTASATGYEQKAEVYVKDESGNVTKISPHNQQGEWEYYSRNVMTGKVVRINMEEMIRDIESLTGKSYIKHE